MIENRTNDAGKTIEKSNKKFNGIMYRASTMLNLKPHLCGAEKAKAKVLCSAADIEGHLGTDGKVCLSLNLQTASAQSFYDFSGQFYLLDFSSTMPPVKPSRKFYNGHLHRLLRSELVVKYPKKLCSDAYSGFIMHDNQYVRGNLFYILFISLLWNLVCSQ